MVYASVSSHDDDGIDFTVRIVFCRIVSFKHELLKSKRWKDKRGNVINIVQKMKDQFYHHAKKGYASGQELYDAFFDHIKGIRNDAGFIPEKWQTSAKWRAQVDNSQAAVRDHVKVEKLDKLVCGMFTAWIESYHSACNLGAPKQKYFPRTMESRMAMVELNWNRDKISSVFYENDEEGSPLEKLEKERRLRASFLDDIMREMIEEGRLFKKGQDQDVDVEPSNQQSFYQSNVTPAAGIGRRRSARLSALSPVQLDADSPQSEPSSSSSKRRRTDT